MLARMVDLAPLKYAGWAEYKAGVKKVFAGFESLSLKLNDDLMVQRRGKVAWATYTFTTELKMKDGKSEKGVGGARTCWKSAAGNGSCARARVVPGARCSVDARP